MPKKQHYLSEEEKTEVVCLFRTDDTETGLTLARRFNVDRGTIGRTLKRAMSEPELKALIRRKQSLRKIRDSIMCGLTKDPALIPSGMKHCRKCGRDKAVTCFPKESSRPDGLYSRCKDCAKEYDVQSHRRKQPKFRLLVYRKDAVKRGLPFALSFDDFKCFWQMPCYYCGADIETIGLDRFDNSRGYEEGNVVSCCTTCNGMKSSRSADDFVTHCRRVANHQVRANSAIATGGQGFHR